MVPAAAQSPDTPVGGQLFLSVISYLSFFGYFVVTCLIFLWLYLDVQLSYYHNIIIFYIMLKSSENTFTVHESYLVPGTRVPTWYQYGKSPKRVVVVGVFPTKGGAY